MKLMVSSPVYREEREAPEDEEPLSSGSAMRVRDAVCNLGLSELSCFFSQWEGPPQGPWSWRHLMTLEMTLEMKCLWAPELLCTASLGPQTPFG